MHRNLKGFLIYFFGILSGYYICILIKKFTALSIDPKISFEINPFEIISLIITILLAIYVTKTLSKQNDLDKSEKDLMLKYIDNFQIEFDAKVLNLLKQDVLDSHTSASDFKILRKKLDSIITLAIQYHFISIPETLSVDLKNSMRDLWELFTDTPKQPNARSSAGVREDIQRLRLELETKIQSTVINIDNLIFHFAMTVNKK